MGRVYEQTWGRAFAALYDRGLKATEEAGLRQMRRELLAGAGGRVLELGAGTGVNLDLYPDAVEDLVMIEPDPHMAKRLRARLAESARSATVVEAPAERLPFEDDSFDTAVATLVLCTIPDPAAALAEAARVLKPGGQLLFVEHVRAEAPAWPAGRTGSSGPGASSATAATATATPSPRSPRSPFEIDELERGRMPKAPPIVSPLVRGSASLPGAGLVG